MFKAFTFYVPVKLVFGEGILEAAGQETQP
jgi:hypothetical protein